MFLLIRKPWLHDKDLGYNLHSNMFLLILELASALVALVITFTFQYVSINTVRPCTDSTAFRSFTFQYVSINTEYGLDEEDRLLNLHSNMFLLIRGAI